MPKRPGRTRTDQYDKFGKLILPDEPSQAEIAYAISVEPAELAYEGEQLELEVEEDA